MPKQITIDKIKEYREFKTSIRHDMNVALKRGFKTQASIIENDIKWLNEIIALINEIEGEK